MWLSVNSIQGKVQICLKEETIIICDRVFRADCKLLYTSIYIYIYILRVIAELSNTEGLKHIIVEFIMCFLIL